ncbi:MAG TPA: M91 family zinc metallopeptidase [Gemmataceae bacterium]|nr:M91 family zinc metallopeptidase [Gemmataceae bacterium]
MSDAATATGRLLAKAQNFGPGKSESGANGVWTRGFADQRNEMANYDPSKEPDVVRSMEALGRGMAGEWNSTSANSIGKGMAQQAGVIGKQLGSLTHLGDGKPPEGVMQHVGAAFGILTSVEQLVSMGLSAIPFPALPAVRIADYDFGLPHAHPHPPNAPPAPPIMLPSTGPVIPIPFMSGAEKVLINGRPAARCGDLGLGIWCGGYFPLYEIYLGSSNVWVEGARAARLAVDITKHCIFSTPKPVGPGDPPIGSMFGFTITASTDVAIGGIPMPSLSAKVMGAAFGALFKKLGKALAPLKGLLGKSSNYRALRSAVGAMRRRAAHNPGKYGLSNLVGKLDFVTLNSYRRAFKLIDEMKKAETLIIRAGDNPNFVIAAERDLGIIASSKTGRKVLEDIHATGKRVVIKEAVGENKAWAKPLEESEARFDFNEAKRGEGANSVVAYDPDHWEGPNSPPDTSLLHELGHARNAARGEDLSNRVFDERSSNRHWTDAEELQTIRDIENPYRRERGLPERTGHDDTP